MPQPRKNIISLGDTPFYHCMSRCVRRAFLCGVDNYSGIDYEHRRDWLEKKLHQVAEAFAIKLSAYAIMHNHYHVVLNVRSDIAASWSNMEIVERWHSLFSGTPTSQSFAAGIVLSNPQKELLAKDITLWRQRLMDISWFMRIVNEAIARRANGEDKCTGRFWEGRFKCQALLDDKALLACMAYVDLNPIRANIATTPELSDHTCIQQRIQSKTTNTSLAECIEAFVGGQSKQIGLPFQLHDYIKLVEWTGRMVREDKRGEFRDDIPPILARLNLQPKAWKILTTKFEQQFNHWVGAEHIVKQIYIDKNYQRLPSTQRHKSLFG